VSTTTTSDAGLIAPHGGILVNRLLQGPQWEKATEEAKNLPRLRLTERQIADVDLITTGGLSPHEGFMTSADYQSVIHATRLANGLVWSIPLVLGVTDEEKAAIGSSTSVVLNDGSQDLAILRIEEIYEGDLDAEARGVYGTADQAHPGVAAIHERGKWLLGGKIDAIGRHEYNEFGDARLTPAQTRRMFADHGWKTVAAFQTRNPIHRAHEYLLRCALEIADGVLVHPLMGATKKGDIPGPVRWECYNVLMNRYFPKDRAALSIFPANMHYAGPKEAIYHALLRKNYGCTHFIVGRDHAGVGDYYGTYDAQQIFNNFTPDEVGIEPLRFEHSFYCHRCEGMASFKTCPHGKGDRVVLAGTIVR
jgi:sulfate adenylyltransferase